MNTPSAPLPPLPEVLRVATDAALQAGALMRERRAAQSVSVSFKAEISRNLVTTTDVESEKLIVSIIKKHFPTHLILAEETAESVPPTAYLETPTWVVDPIDGTTNFAHGHPHVGVSIAYTVAGVVQVGVVLAPFSGELFTGTLGGGSYLDGQRLSVSNASSLEDALIATGFPYDRSDIQEICSRLCRVAARCRDIRRYGAASLDICWVACGRIDAFYEETLMPWDGAAGCLIAKEAGARIGHYPYTSPMQRKTEIYPGDLSVDNLIVATPKVFDELSKELARGG